MEESCSIHHLSLNLICIQCNKKYCNYCSTQRKVCSNPNHELMTLSDYYKIDNGGGKEKLNLIEKIKKWLKVLPTINENLKKIGKLSELKNGKLDYNLISFCKKIFTEVKNFELKKQVAINKNMRFLKTLKRSLILDEKYLKTQNKISENQISHMGQFQFHIENLGNKIKQLEECVINPELYFKNLNSYGLLKNKIQVNQGNQGNIQLINKVNSINYSIYLQKRVLELYSASYSEMSGNEILILDYFMKDRKFLQVANERIIDNVKLFNCLISLNDQHNKSISKRKVIYKTKSKKLPFTLSKSQELLLSKHKSGNKYIRNKLWTPEEISTYNKNTTDSEILFYAELSPKNLVVHINCLSSGSIYKIPFFNNDDGHHDNDIDLEQHKNFIFACGGRFNGQYLNSCWALNLLDLSKNGIIQKQNFTKGRNLTSLVSSPNDLYLIGGYNGSFFKECEKYNVEKNIWVPSFNLNQPTCFANSNFFFPSYIYIFGGSSAKYFERIDIRSEENKCEQLNIEFEGDLYRASFKLKKNEVLLFGGRFTNHFCYYDIKKNEIKPTNIKFPSNLMCSSKPRYFKGILYAISVGKYDVTDFTKKLYKINIENLDFKEEDPGF